MSTHCDWPLEPNWYPTYQDFDAHSAECGAPAVEVVTFRRKSDGHTETSPRCAAHRNECNGRWEPV